MLGERLKPADLDQDAVVDQAVFAEEPAQRLCFFSIATVDRGKGEELGVLVHGISFFSESSEGLVFV